MIWLLLSTLATAGNLAIAAPGPVVVRIDGVVLEFPEGRDGATAYALRRGRHLVEVRNLLGRRITELEVAVPWNEIVSLRYAKHRLEVTGSELLPGHEQPPPPPVDDVVAETTVVPAPEAPPEPVKVSLPDTVEVGSIEIVGSKLDVVVNQAEVAFSQSTGSYQVTGLYPTDYPVKISQAGKLRYDATLSVKGNQNTRCKLEGDDLNCRTSKPGLGVTTVKTTSLDAASILLVVADARAKAEAEAAAGPPAPVEVIFKLQDALDYCNVYIGGVKAFEFRKGSEPAQTRSLEVGMHPIEVKDFTDTEVWASGKLVVKPGEPIHVDFSSQGLKVDREDGWVPGTGAAEEF